MPQLCKAVSKKHLVVGILLSLFSSMLISPRAQMPIVYNSTDIYQQLKKLKVLGSILYVAAHPDDENNGLLPYLTKEKLYRTAYLSLTRGDGGQNLIGSEQGIELGLIRTQELLAARRMDGAEQYFTRAYEFGFSKSVEEALRIWDREKVLSDIVWIIRKYQPDIIITRFPGDARAGHGHHGASAVLAQEAYSAAADPKKFTEQFAYGVKPWQAKRMLWNTFNFGGANTTSNDQFTQEVGGYNALLGKSYGEIGAEARTMHKSQGEGRPRRRGSLVEYFQTIEGDAPKNDLLDGIETDWHRIKGAENIQSQINSLIRQYNFEKPVASVAALVHLYQAIKNLPVSNWRDKKLTETQDLIEACAGLYTEATTAQEKVVQGDALGVSLFLTKRNEVKVSLTHIQLDNFDTSFQLPLLIQSMISIPKTIQVALDKKIAQPYWLINPKAEGIFDVRDQLEIGKAWNDPSFLVNFTLNIEGEDFIIQRPVQYKFVDPAKGELYQPVVVLPQVETYFTKENFISINGAPIVVGIMEKENVKNGRGHFTGTTPLKGFIKQNEASQLSIHSSNGYSQLVYTPVSKTDNHREPFQLVGNEQTVIGSAKQIAYDHIPTITYFTPSKTNLLNLNIKLSSKKIGYINGAGDKLPEALEDLGYAVTILTEEDITVENLAQFDAVITGIRASNLFEYLTNKNEVLNTYVANGGNLIAQYIKSNTVGSKKIKLGPYPFSISSSSRVTEENAKINILLPQHPVFNYPNTITEADFEGWVQERSTYQVDQADVHYEMPLAMHDSGNKETNGSLAITKFGKGNFAYVSLVLFRQLPAGIPGAYRLLANLIALPKNE